MKVSDVSEGIPKSAIQPLVDVYEVVKDIENTVVLMEGTEKFRMMLKAIKQVVEGQK